MIDKEGVSTKSITIVSNAKKENSVLKDTDQLGQYKISTSRAYDGEGVIAYRTIQGFKGLESDIVIYINETIKGIPTSQNARMTLYTAYTRAKYFLHAINFIKEDGAN